MKQEKDSLINSVREHVMFNFSKHQKDGFVYHNLDHTQSVVKAAKKLAAHYDLSEEDHRVLMTAAWFHDIGYFKTLTNHEQASAEEAEAFLTEHIKDDAFTQRVKHCILATRIPQQPKNLVEQLLCDADLFHLGTDEFFDRNKLLRKEFKSIHHLEITKRKWIKKSIDFLSAHRFHSAYARELLSDGRLRNINALQANKNKMDAVNDKDEKKEKGKSNRTIETMFRITSNNHQRLSDLADNKAQIMITVNSIILSVLISVLLRKLEENPNLTIPAFLLLAVNLLTIIFAILATRPNLAPGVFTQEEINRKEANLLFFGNFHRMSLPDYTKGVFNMMGDREYLYRSLIKDIHAQGVVLGRKYYLLRICYNIFMFGIILAVIAFIIASFYTKRIDSL